MAKITAERARELLSYDPDTGILVWRTSNRRMRAGEIAGKLRPNGYIMLGLDHAEYRAHRVIFLIMTGRWPEPECDHEDLDGANNRWLNLREATRSQNGANKRMHPKNRSGLKGVSWCKQTKRWRAQLSKDNKPVNIGRFDCPAAAHLAYLVTADISFKEFSRAS